MIVIKGNVMNIKIGYIAAAAILFSASARSVDVSKVYGNIQVVDAFPDYKVKVVSAFADLDVQVVNAFPNAPGKWKMVNALPNYKIQFVDAFSDFTIRYVTAFPGKNR
jgi:hypothetical protein